MAAGGQQNGALRNRRSWAKTADQVVQRSLDYSKREWNFIDSRMAFRCPPVIDTSRK
jgi:hypothetical protein